MPGTQIRKIIENKKKQFTDYGYKLADSIHYFLYGTKLFNDEDCQLVAAERETKIYFFEHPRGIMSELMYEHDEPLRREAARDQFNDVLSFFEELLSPFGKLNVYIIRDKEGWWLKLKFEPNTPKQAS